LNDTATAPSTATVMIVGATSDIGRAIARCYAAAGRPLVLCAHRPSAVQRDAEDLRLRYGVAVEVVELDLLDTASHTRVLDNLSPLPGTVVMLAGLLGEQERAALEAPHAAIVMRSNYEAPALFLGETANRMERRGSGVIIGVSSVAGDRGRATNYVYGSAKAGFTAFLSGLRNRLTRRGVHVVTIKPGFVRTRMIEGMKTPARLTAEPAQVAAAVLAAEAGSRNIVYVLWIWKPIMTVIRLLPESIFKRMRL
jgi:decaprenylphospho-beta-D-erythro-pentofuranosid-2-ulose 2-reductase